MGPRTRPKQRVTQSTSLFSESSPCCEQITSCPSACSVGISFWKHEPSAQSPWAKTMLGLVAWLMALSHRPQDRLSRGDFSGGSHSFGHPLAGEIYWACPYASMLHCPAAGIRVAFAPEWQFCARLPFAFSRDSLGVRSVGVSHAVQRRR